MQISKIIKILFNHKYFIAFITGFTGMIIFIFYYFTVLLNNNNDLFVNNTINLFKQSFITKNKNIIDNIERVLNIQKSAITKYKNNLTQDDFFQISRSDIDPFNDVYNTYRYSKLIYNEDINFYNEYGKNYINSQYNIKNTNQSFYVPIEYSDPNIFADASFGFNLYNFSSTKPFFNKFESIYHKVIEFSILFASSIDEFDTGMYCGIINYDDAKCNITLSNSFESLIINNKNNKKCIQGFSYIAIIARDYINNILKSINTFPNVNPKNLHYIIFDNDNSKNIKIISRSDGLINKNINKLSDINKFKKNYYKTLQFNNFFKFSNDSVNNNAVIYIFFDKSIQNKEILTQINIVNILIPTSYTLFLISFIIIYKLYHHNVNISNDKYIETKKLMTYVNHELRNPLNIIYGITQVIEKKITNIIYELINNQKYIDGMPVINLSNDKNIYSSNFTADDFPNKYHKFAFDSLKEIHSNIMTAHNSARISSIIVNDVLDLQKLEDNKITTNNTYFSSMLFINDFYKTILHKSDENIPTVKTFIYIDENILFFTDKDRLVQIIVNIYTNSIKYTKNGKIVIIIKYSEDNDFIDIIISDNGSGINNDIKKDIFKKTFSNNKSSVSSVGIGLYIVGMISKIIDCNIVIESKIGFGTIFYLKIKNYKKNQNKNNFPDILITESIISKQIKTKYISIDSNDFNENDYIVDLNDNKVEKIEHDIENIN